jgi:NAD(P)-dependent dehydrogenase (short-subunit alcohol dehydrogenase family)
MATESPGEPSRRRPEPGTAAPAGAKVALVTGASRGIGRSVALALARRGHAVALAARTAPALAAVAAEVEAAGGRSLAVAADVADEAQAEAMVARALERFGRLDALVNAAGVGSFGPTAELTLVEWERQLRVNLTGTFLACRAALRPMLAQRSGQIVNILSIASKVAFPGAAAYCASKWGALGFTRVLAEEVRRQGIRVTAFCPGSVETPFWEGIEAHPDFARMLRPEDVAEAVAFILEQPPGIVTDEIVVMPPEGIL